MLVIPIATAWIVSPLLSVLSPAPALLGTKLATQRKYALPASRSKAPMLPAAQAKPKLASVSDFEMTSTALPTRIYYQPQADLAIRTVSIYVCRLDFRPSHSPLPRHRVAPAEIARLDFASYAQFFHCIISKTILHQHANSSTIISTVPWCCSRKLHPQPHIWR